MSIIPRASYSDDSRMVIKKPLSKSLLLRDYLLDDMSSCSSNGFKSYPRHRQCCTTIRFLVEMDLNKHNNNKLLPNQHRHTVISKSKSNYWKTNSKPKQPSMMQRASSMMINAFKHFPFPSTKKSPMISLSRKLLKHGLWKKSTHNRNNEVKQLISLGDLLKKTDINCPTTSPSMFSITVFSSVPCTNNDIDSNSSNSNSWSGSDFTATTDSFATSNSSGVNKNDTVNELLERINEKGVSTTTTNADNADASEEIAKEWQNEQDEQSSPVCVMDFPSDNDKDEDEVSSLFQHSHLEVEGTKNLMRKTRRLIKDVPQIEPVKLETRIAKLAQEKDIVKQKALALLQQIKSTFSSHHLFKSEAVESLLLAFFKERIGDNVYDYEMLQTAKDWMDGHLEEMPLDWECQKNRKSYVRDMENVVKWSKYDDEVEKNDIGLELECGIFTSLVNDILLEFRL
uniref:uncharacterized protein LOC122585758 n=1 Tax=Erigeron canadensis TaxID=72917 RepID=UPI001CB8F6D0|nr:uncharacterized protein LOC122585758 [Erigeron canadensis]